MINSSKEIFNLFHFFQLFILVSYHLNHIFLMIKNNKSAEEVCEALGFGSGSKRVYTIMDETKHLCYKFFGNSIFSTQAILDHKKRAKEAKKNLLF